MASNLNRITDLPYNDLMEWLRGTAILIVPDEATWERLDAAMKLAKLEAPILMTPVPF